MYLAVSLVSIILSASQCRSQPTGNERQYSLETILYQQYQPSDHNRIKQERQILHQVPRVHGQFQRQYEPELENYSEDQYDTQSAEIPSRNIKGSKSQTNLPVVEQYLKEVTPTTKTVYDPRDHKNVENKLIQYSYRSQSPPEEQKSVYLPETEARPKGAPVAQNILAYHNALLARQNSAYEQQRINQIKKEQQQQRQLQQDAIANSEIYGPQQIQKTVPSVRKVVKLKPGSLDEELEYYLKLQYEEQQKKEKVERPLPKQTAAAQSQFRISQNPEGFVAEEIAFQPGVQPLAVPTKIAKPSDLPKEQVYLSDINYQQKIVYQPQPQQPEAQDIRYYQQQPQHAPQLIQYQLRALPSPNTEPKQTYTPKIVKYQAVQSEPVTGPKQPVNINQEKYVFEEPAYQPQRYEFQQNQEQPQAQLQPKHQPPPEENSRPSDEDYQQSQFKKSLGRNSSLRVLKSGKSVVFIGHDE